MALCGGLNAFARYFACSSQPVCDIYIGTCDAAGTAVQEITLPRPAIAFRLAERREVRISTLVDVGKDGRLALQHRQMRLPRVASLVQLVQVVDSSHMVGAAHLGDVDPVLPGTGVLL